MKKYDYEKAISMIESSKELAEAQLGMKDDWGWTSETVWKDGVFECDLKNKPAIAGISGSTWATPAILLIFKNGAQRAHGCFISDGSESKMSEIQKAVVRLTGSDTLKVGK